MDDLQTSDEVNFIPETVEPICFDIIDAALRDKPFSNIHVQQQIDDICTRITKELVNMNKPFKYIVSCAIMQKNGAGLHARQSCYWDAVTDNNVIVRWPSEKKKDPNARVICVVNVFGVAC